MDGQHAPLLDSSRPFTDAELDAITSTMPLTAKYSIPDGAFDGWTLLFRDHYLEHSVGFVLAAEHSGLPPEWIFTMAKGDRTRNRERIHSTFLARGYRSMVFDNAWIDADPGATPGDADQAELVSADSCLRQLRALLPAVKAGVMANRTWDAAASRAGNPPSLPGVRTG